VSFDDEISQYFLASGFDDEQLSGALWDGKSYSIKKQISIDEIKNKKLRIKHYYGLATITYTGIYAFALHYFTKWIYIKIHIGRFVDSLSQFLFNRTRLIKKGRIELLRFMLQDQIDRTSVAISVVDLMIKVHSIKVILHPLRDQQKKQLQLYLDSLVESGDLALNPDNHFIVTGKAINTIERYDEEERRHKKQFWIQIWMLVLTVFLVILTAIQSGLIKLPTLIDWEKK
jgi:predicted nucleic acid-binding Zn ribbon protein